MKYPLWSRVRVPLALITRRKHHRADMWFDYGTWDGGSQGWWCQNIWGQSILKGGDKGGSQFCVKRGPKKEPFWGEKFSPVLVTLVVGEDSRPQLDWRSPPLPPTTTHTLFSFLAQNRDFMGQPHWCGQGTRFLGDVDSHVEVPGFWWGPLGTLLVELAGQPAAGSSRDSIDRLSFCIDYTTCYSQMRAHCRTAKPDWTLLGIMGDVIQQGSHYQRSHCLFLYISGKPEPSLGRTAKITELFVFFWKEPSTHT